MERVLDAGLFWLGSGLSDPDLSLPASLALFAAYGLEKPAALNGPQYQRDSILVEPICVTGDRARVPSATRGSAGRALLHRARRDRCTA